MVTFELLLIIYSLINCEAAATGPDVYSYSAKKFVLEAVVGSKWNKLYNFS